MSSWAWNVDPVIFHLIGPFSIRWYGLIFVTGLYLGNQGFLALSRGEGRKIQGLDTLFMYVVLGTVIGARLGHVLFYTPSLFLERPLDIVKTWQGGLASHGGFLGVLISIFLFKRKYKPQESFLYFADRMSIFGLMVGGFIRLGNFFNSEMVGKPTSMPWGIIFSQVDSVPRHPTQLYEAFGYFFIAAFSYGIFRKFSPLKEGKILGLVLSLGFLYRFFMEFFKIPQEFFEVSWPLNMGQILSLPFIGIGLFLFFRKAPESYWNFQKINEIKT